MHTPKSRSRMKHKRTALARERILRALKVGLSYDKAARIGGISDVTLVEWRKEDPEFASECESARCEMELAQLTAIEQASQSGYWQAAAWKLERIFPERYGRKWQSLAMAQEKPVDEAHGKVYTIAIKSM